MTTQLNKMREQSQALAQGATAQPPRIHQSCEIAARLEAPPDTQNGRLIFQATALFDGPHTTAGQTDTYIVRADRLKECLDNLNKGAGSTPGSVLVFGNAWRDREKGNVSIGWVTTAVSAQKVQAGLNGHQSRRLEQVYAQMPILDFTNVQRAPGEPERIRWPLGQDQIEARVQTDGRWQTAIFDRDWLKAKLTDTWEARLQQGVSINLRLPVLYPEQAVAVRDLDSAAQGVAHLLKEHPYRSVLTRVSDGTSVETRWQPLMRGQDTAAWAGKLLAQTPGFDAEGRPVADPETGEQVMIDQFSLIPGVDNRLLLEAAQQGALQVEFLPRDALLLATKNAPGLANEIKAILQAATARDLHSITFAFGGDPEAVSRMALILQEQPDHRVFVVSHPIRLDVGPAYNVTTVPSPHLSLPASPPAPASDTASPEQPLESARMEDAPPQSEEEDFELDIALNAGWSPEPVAPTSPPVAHPAPAAHTHPSSPPAKPSAPRKTRRPAPSPPPPLVPAPRL